MVSLQQTDARAWEPDRPAPGFPREAVGFAPGRLGRGGIGGALLFDAARFGGDPLALFFASDAPLLDWLRDYLCDPDLETVFRFLAAEDQDDEPEIEEEVYSRAEMANLSGGSMLDDS